MKLIANQQRLFHKKEFRIYGARRSGNHAIINWICANSADQGNSVCFLNDINNNFPLKGNVTFGCPLPSLPTEKQTHLLKKPDHLVMSFEEDNALKWAVELETPCKNRQLIWVRRDPLEVWASRLARVEKLKQGLESHKRKGQPWEFNLVGKKSNGTFKFLETWKSYHPVPENVLVIHYDLWNSDQNYRIQLATRLKIGLKDIGKKSIPGYGFGPSFDSPPKAGELRYPKLVHHPLMREFEKQLRIGI
ncbi:MAG: hypothetical protein P1V20_25695 [Verrucomicrobiales bacterium]|nr:hypothetical protein [Verrucomicrobiales bacterium]